jgi:transcriptional regulator with XRE-family HTH domain
MKKTLRRRIGKNVREARETLDMTQDLFARKAKISRGFLSDVERGARAISVETFISLCRASGLAPEALVT